MNKNITAYYTLIRREVLRIFRIWPQALIPPIITTVLYLTIFGNLIGSRLGSIAGDHQYIEFVIPGLIIMAIMSHSYENTVASFFISKFQRSIEELLVSSTPNYIIILGYISGGMARGFVVGSLVYLSSIFFIYLPIQHLILLFIITILTSIIFSLLAVLNAIFARSFDDISWVPSFVLTPMIYLGGVFFSIEMLPEFWRNLAIYNPVFHIISVFRYAFLGTGSIEIYLSLLIMFVLAIVLFFMTLKTFDKGIGLKQ